MIRTSFNITPFPKVPKNHFLRFLPVSSLFDSANVECPILPVKASNTTHIVSIVGKFVASEAVLGTIRHRLFRIR